MEAPLERQVAHRPMNRDSQLNASILNVIMFDAIICPVNFNLSLKHAGITHIYDCSRVNLGL